MTRQYSRRGWLDRARPRVLDVAPGLIHESGPARDRDWAPDRVAVMAHWSTSAEPSRSVVTMLRELDAAGFATLLVSAAEVPGPIGRVCTWAPGEPAVPARTTVLRRVNVGYDFGSWASVLAGFPGVAAAPRVLLVNDSLIGPFAPLGPILADFESCRAAVWGLSGSHQYRPHVQSFFFGFKDRILTHPVLGGFWSDVRVEKRKSKIVRFEELGLSEALDEGGIPWRTLVVPTPHSGPNQVISAWTELLGETFPFVKAEVLRRPEHTRALDDQVHGHVAWDLRGWLPQEIPAAGSGRAARSAPGVFQRARVAADIRGVRALFRG